MCLADASELLPSPKRGYYVSGNYVILVRPTKFLGFVGRARIKIIVSTFFYRSNYVFTKETIIVN